ncbi:UNVERIFIED_CONTAM: protein SIEVE ELEMENT OCCLUSION B [Sesamum radiatum]|uniref:Protein SIEVE ELEMENT OCCLUSION B n=1 Tax=Sesamum radiatum TaxID=300843 RepID=A0AAW2JU45_SESRA
MAARDFMPPPSTDKVPPARTPGGGHSFVTDHGINPTKEHEHHTVNPIPSSAQVAARGRLGRADRAPNFFSSDDALTKQIVATHAPDMEDLDVRPVLSIVEDIMRLARPSSADTTHVAQTQSHVDKLDDKVSHIPYHHDDKIYHTTEHDAEIVRVLAYPINKTSCEIICKCAGGGESHAITMDLLKSLSSYSWDAKVVITLAAFSINYGEFWLVEQQHTKNALAKNIATLKDLPDIIAHAGELRKKFEAVLDLLTQVLKVTHCIIEFKELPPLYISRESPEITAATAHIPTAVYWIIRGLLTCASTLLNLVGSGREYVTSTAESWEIQNLAHKLSVILDHLQDQLKRCKDLIDRKKAEDAYIAFKKLMETAHIDNMKVLRAMIRSREDQRPLYHGTRRTNERLEELRLKYVLLLISDLELPHEELNVLHLIYNQHNMRHEYEVLWFSIVNSTTSTASLTDPIFYDLRNNHMPWYSVDHPSLIEPVAIRYIREVWNFVHMPMLVVLDPQGKPSNLDALPMMWIWIKENYVICIYGGDDIDWIRKFTLAARAAATSLHIHLEMLYVGKRNPKEKVRLCHEVIDKEKLSNVFSVTEYYDYVWYFWVRLWSMWNSKKQMGMTVENDRIMQEIMDVLALDSSEKGWAVFSRANFEITKSNGDKLLPVLEHYRDWIYKVDHPDKFVTVLDEELKRVHPDHHCNRLILPGHAGYIPERVVCSECGKTMDKYVMYRCCTD